MYWFVGLSFVLSVILIPLIIKFCKKFSLYDYQSARKIHSGNIPRLGGIGIFAAFFISAALYLYFSESVSLRESLPLLLAALIIFVFGLLDDLKNLPAIVKLLVQLTATAIVTLNGYRFTHIGSWEIPTILSFMLTFGWVLGVINAYNLIDGMDALCGSLSFTGVTTLGVLYLLSSNYEGILCFILAAAILGFLVFNWPPAKIFMGDNGSQFLGFMIATIPLYTSGAVFEYNKFMIMIVLTAFPVFDTIAAIWRRVRDRRPIMSPDKAHLHHKLLNMGYTQKQALFLIDGIQVLLCCTVVLSYFLGTTKGAVLLIEAFVFMLILFGIIHYTNRSVNRKHMQEAEANGEVPAAETTATEEKND